MPLSEQLSCLGLIDAQFVSFLVHITRQPDFLKFYFHSCHKPKNSCKSARVGLCISNKQEKARCTKAGRLGWWFSQIQFAFFSSLYMQALPWKPFIWEMVPNSLISFSMRGEEGEVCWATSGAMVYPEHSLLTWAHFNSHNQLVPPELFSPSSGFAGDCIPGHTEAQLRFKPRSIWFTITLQVSNAFWRHSALCVFAQ